MLDVQDDDSKYIVPPAGKADSHLPDLYDFARRNNLQIGSTVTGTHNRGSKHYTGNAFDIKNSGTFSDEQVSALSEAARLAGFKLRDERKRPQGQAVWDGPHIHVEYVGNGDPDAKYFTVASPQQPAASQGIAPPPTPLTPAITSTIRDDGGNELPTSNITKVPRLTGGEPATSPSVGMQITVPLHPDDTAQDIYESAYTRALLSMGFKADEAQTLGLQMAKAQAVKTNGQLFKAGTNIPLSDSELSDLKATGTTSFSFDDPEFVAQLKAAAESNKPFAQRAAQAVISAANMGTPDTKFMAGAAIKAGAGLAEAGGGALRIGLTPNLIGQMAGLRDPFASAEQAIERQAAGARTGVTETSGYDPITEGAQNLTAGAIETAPLALTTAGTGIIPAAASFGTYGALQSAGQGAPLSTVAKEGGKQVLIGGLLGAEGAGIHPVIRTGATTLGAFGVEKAAGTPTGQALQSAATTGLLRTIGEVKEYVHADFGKVAESTNQSGVPRGKLRVTDADGNDHVIIKPSTVRNQRAVPISQPAEAELRPSQPATVPAETQPSIPASQGAAGVAPPPDHPVATSITRGEIDPAVVLDTPLARTVMEDLNEAREITAQPANTSGESNPRMAQPDTSGERVAAKEGLTAPPVSLPVPGERQFPKSAVAAGLPDATDLTYAVNTDVGAVERANARIQQDGAERVAADIRATAEPSKDDIVAGSILAHRLTESGNVAGAVDVIDDLAAKLTNAGQTVQAASLISRLSPEGVLLAAQRRMPVGEKLAPEQAQLLVEQAAQVRVAEAKVAELQREFEKLKGNSGEAPLTPRAARTRVSSLQERLAKLESDARARLAARVGVGKGGETGASTIPLDIADYAIIGAAKLARSGITLAQWTDEMVGEFGDAIRPHIKSLYRDSYQIYDEHRQQVLQESRERSALRAEPDAPNLQAVINARLDAQTQARKARLELARTFTDLNKTGLQKFGQSAIDVLNLPRALTTTLDLSAAMRQGKMGLLRHPKVYLDAFLKQFKALSTDQYDRMMSERELDPSYKYVRRFGLDLTSHAVHEVSKLGAREEAFQTGLAEKVPIMRHSEQAYSTMLDELRVGWFKEYMKNAVNAGFDPEKLADFQAFKEGAQLINNATGRGSLGRLQGATPALNTVFFSPRFWASRLKLLTLPFDPRTYTQMSRPARVEAFKTLFSFTALVSAQVGLAKLAGAQVDTDPDSPDFLKAKFGKVHIDFSAGFQNHIRTALKLAKAIDSDKPKQTPTDILGTYARTKESPNASLIHDLFFSKKKQVNGTSYGTDFKGAPTSLLGIPGQRLDTSAAFKRLVPMTIQDAVDAYQLLGWKGVGEVAVPSILGEGVSTYDPTKKLGIKPPPLKSAPKSPQP